MKNVILIAPPGAGKGTLSDYLISIGYVHLSTGDLLRKEIALETDIGKEIKDLMKDGKLVTDAIIVPLFKESLKEIKDKPFILDGFPRRLKQAEYLTDLFRELNITDYVVINLDISREILEKRILGRRYCLECGSSYNVYFEEFKPKVDNICDKCCENLIVRTDDNIEAFNGRYEEYMKECELMLKYYQEQNVLEVIDASKEKSDIIEDTLKLIRSK